jgi:hypothetical protein
MNLFKRKPKLTFPNDEDGDTLRSLSEKGVDFTVPHDVDFFISISSKEQGDNLLPMLKTHGLTGTLEQDEESGEWICFCTKNIMLDYDEIVATQEFLDELCKPYDLYSDGWGTFGD